VEIEFDDGIDVRLETGHEDHATFRIEVEGSRNKLAVSPTSLAVGDTTVADRTNALTHECRVAQFQEFVDWVHGRRSDYAASADVAEKSAELVLAAYESIRQGAPVSLPLTNHSDVIRECFWGEDHDSCEKSERSTPFWEFAEHRPLDQRPAIAGGNRAVRRWFNGAPHIGMAEWINVTRVIRSKNLGRVGGKMVPQLETEMAGIYGSPCAVASTSGTAAIHVALGALDPEPGDEVITTPISDMGTVIPILMSNCVPVFADVDPQTGNLTAETIAAKITARTKAVVLVHLFGRPADMTPIVQLLKARDIYLIEDCAQAHLAEYAGKRVGTWGDFGAFSFQQSKQITCGDGGITLVNRPELARRAQLFADKGWDRRAGRKHEMLGMNYRMTDLQGAVALAQLRKLPAIIGAGRRMADQLCEYLANVPGVLVAPSDKNVRSSWWKFPLGLDENVLGLVTDEFYDALSVEGLRLPKQYLPRPLFEEDMLRKRKTYGQSGYPITPSAYQQPDVADYPGLIDFNRIWFPMDWSSRVQTRHVSQIAAAVTKVARALEGGAAAQFQRRSSMAASRLPAHSASAAS
jgi:perosamine synthetase